MYYIKGRVSNFWKPLLIFEITKTNTSLPQKGLPPILIDPSHIYIAYATQAMISSVKHKELFHQNYLEKYVPGTFFPQTCCCLRFHCGLSTEKIRQIVWWRNARSARISQYQVHKLLWVLSSAGKLIGSDIYTCPTSCLTKSLPHIMIRHAPNWGLATCLFWYLTRLGKNCIPYL